MIKIALLALLLVIPAFQQDEILGGSGLDTSAQVDVSGS